VFSLRELLSHALHKGGGKEKAAIASRLHEQRAIRLGVWIKKRQAAAKVANFEHRSGVDIQSMSTEAQK